MAVITGGGAVQDLRGPGAVAGTYVDVAARGKYAYMTMGQRLDYQKDLMTRLADVNKSIENLRVGYVQTSMDKVGNAHALFGTIAQYDMSKIQFRDAAQERKFGLFKEQHEAWNNSPHKAGILTQNPDHMYGYTSVLQSSKTQNSVTGSLDGALDGVTEPMYTKLLTQPEKFMDEAGKHLTVAMTDVEDHLLLAKNAAGGSNLAHGLMSKGAKDLMTTVMIQKLEKAAKSAGVAVTQTQIDAIHQVVDRHGPQQAGAVYQDEEYRRTQEEWNEMESNAEESVKAVGPGSFIYKEYEEMKSLYGGSLKVSASDLAEEASGLKFKNLEQQKALIERELKGALAGSEIWPLISANMQIPGMMTLNKALGNPPTMDGMYRTMRYMGSAPGQSAKAVSLYVQMSKDPEFGGNKVAIASAMRMYLEEQVDEGMMKHRMFRTKKGVKSTTVARAIKGGMNPIQLGRLRKGVQAFSRTGKVEIEQPGPDEMVGHLLKTINDANTPEEIIGIYLSGMMNNPQIPSETWKKIEEDILPAILMGREDVLKKEEIRKMGMRPYEMGPDLLDMPDATLLGTEYYDEDRRTPGGVSRAEAEKKAIHAVQEDVDLAGAPLTRGPDLGEYASDIPTQLSKIARMKDMAKVESEFAKETQQSQFPYTEPGKAEKPPAPIVAPVTPKAGSISYKGKQVVPRRIASVGKYDINTAFLDDGTLLVEKSKGVWDIPSAEDQKLIDAR